MISFGTLTWHSSKPSQSNPTNHGCLFIESAPPSEPSLSFSSTTRSWWTKKKNQRKVSIYFASRDFHSLWTVYYFCFLQQQEIKERWIYTFATSAVYTVYRLCVLLVFPPTTRNQKNGEHILLPLEIYTVYRHCILHYCIPSNNCIFTPLPLEICMAYKSCVRFHCIFQMPRFLLFFTFPRRSLASGLSPSGSTNCPPATLVNMSNSLSRQEPNGSSFCSMKYISTPSAHLHGWQKITV